MFQGRSCGKSWTFERVVDMELVGYVQETVRGITKTECEDRCLSENGYSCKSASYDHMRQECHLSIEDRFTQPKAFVAKQGTDYLENQCESSTYACYTITSSLYSFKHARSIHFYGLICLMNTRHPILLHLYDKDMCRGK